MYINKKILAIITARGGSKGLPRKNILNLGNHPLIGWTIDAAKKSKYIDNVIVSTDDKEIADISLKYGAEVPFLRPDYLATDKASSVDVVEHAIKEYELINNEKFDYIILLQPTSPFRNSHHIDNSIENLLENKSNFNSLVSVTEIDFPINWIRTIKDNKLVQVINYDKKRLHQRQMFDKNYRLNGAIYLIKKITFLKNKMFETSNTMAFVMDKDSSIDIDNINDFNNAKSKVLSIEK